MPTSITSGINTRIKTARMARADWIRYIRDHKNYLIKNSSVLQPADILFSKYMLRPISYLEKAGVPVKLIQTVMLINDMSMVEPLEERHRYIFLPDEEIFDNLVVLFSDTN